MGRYHIFYLLLLCEHHGGLFSLYFLVGYLILSEHGFMPKNKPYFHMIWHIFIVLASFLHMIGILFYVIATFCHYKLERKISIIF